MPARRAVSMPMPWSRTDNRAMPASSPTSISMDFPAPNLTAFDTRFVTTWSIREPSQRPRTGRLHRIESDHLGGEVPPRPRCAQQVVQGERERGDGGTQLVGRDLEELVTHANGALGLAVEACVVERDGGPVRNLPDEVEIDAPVPSRCARRQREHPEDLAPRRQRHGEQAASPERADEAQMFVILGQVSKLLVGGGWDPDWRAGAQAS